MSGGGDHKIRRWNTESWECRGEAPQTDKDLILCLALSNDGSDGNVRRWNVKRGM